MITGQVARTRHGSVIGHDLDEIRVFKGIPYARPPVGELRFKPPCSPEPWQEILTATKFGPAPAQLDTPMMGPIGPVSEDCLTLNVWAPKSPGPHPVLFWIFGGANILGAASQPIYDGTYYAQNNIIFVSANYRLGALGCLELGAIIPELAGSSLNGLRDLVAALEWVRDNIAEFGGDPAKVTIMGQSAGAKNVCALMAIPAAQGLFHRAAVQSGGGHTVYASLAESAPVAHAFIEAAALTPQTAENLRTLPIDVLMSAQARLLQTYPKGFLFRPTVDGKFLPRRPIDAVRAGASRRIDLLIGTCLDEAATLFQGPPSLPFEARQLANIPLRQMEEMDERYAKTLTELSLADRHIRVLTAEEYWIPSVEFAQAHAASNGATYMYRFDHKSVSGRLTGYAGHGSDLPYTWTPPSSDPFLQFFGDVDAELRRRLLAMWCDWIKTGNAKIADAPTWDLYNPASRPTMLINAVCQMTDDPARDQRVLWDGLF